MVAEKRDVSKQIAEILTVLFFGIAAALLLAFGVLYYFGPSGNYKAGNVLLSPEVSQKLSFKDQNQKQSLFLFDKVELSFFNDKSKEWVRTTLNQKNYAKFYESISSERSINPLPEQIVSLFMNARPVTLTILVKSENKANEGNSVLPAPFQQLQILPYGDYYRIEIRENTEGENWAYFYHEGIYTESMKLFLE